MEKVFILFLVFRVSTTVSDVCSNDSNGKCNSFEGHDRYSKDKRWQHLLQTIDESMQKYSPCDLNCRCHNEQVSKDLTPWKEDGISWSALQEAKPYGTYYQIINHTLYREDNCMFPFRCYGVEYFLNKIAKKIPDVEFILNTRDWPQVSQFRKPIPVFSFSKTSSYLDIMYPAWSFWEGGPALGIYPTGLGRWDKQRELIKKAAEEWSWEKKKSLAFFRGSRTSPERDRLVLLSRTNPNLVDAQYTKNQAWKSDADTLNMPPAEEVKLEDHCQYKYLFNFRGVAASFRFKHLFLCKSLVFHVEDEWLEFFYPSIKPWVHYIPVAPGATEQELESIIQFAADNDKVAQQIAERGFEFIWNQLRIKDIRCYWTKLLKSYAALQKFKPERQETLRLVLPRER